jgi:hypothetical protein
MKKEEVNLELINYKIDQIQIKLETLPCDLRSRSFAKLRDRVNYNSWVCGGVVSVVLIAIGLILKNIDKIRIV